MVKNQLRPSKHSIVTGIDLPNFAWESIGSSRFIIADGKENFGYILNTANPFRAKSLDGQIKIYGIGGQQTMTLLWLAVQYQNQKAIIEKLTKKLEKNNE